jgi:Tol biopolymer transport system component
MLLNAGSQLGVYEIGELIGAGGMGEVYRARDTKLDRDVALKVLPGALAGDSRYMARFQHEAHVLASLNHPHIASLHGLEECDGVRALVMELVEGRTLLDRIKSGPMPVEEALNIARQIAEALEYAHEKGIVHRDLKPANVKLTPEGTVKVLDFGLAKAVEPISGDKPLEEAATVPVSMSQPGMIIGSAEYMAPEQARGQAVDKRADIWAFGVVLLEMLTGTRTFGGATVEETLAAVLTKEPEWGRLPAGTPASIRKLLGRCLERDRRKRLQAIGDARIEIEEYLANPVADAPPRRRSVLPWAVAAVLAVAAATVSLHVFRRAAPDSPLLTYTIAPQENLGYHMVAPSPDGRMLAFVTMDASNKTRLWLRRLGSPAAQALPGTEGAILPFWSPDSRFLGYLDNGAGEIKKSDIGAQSGLGAPRTICQAVANQPGGATWNRDGVVLFGGIGRPLSRANAAGGPVTPATTLDASRSETSQLWPWFLPDGRHFLYTSVSRLRENNGIYVGTLDSPDRKRLLDDYSLAEYVKTPAEGGLLLFVRGRTLMAQRFDATRLQLTGEPQAIAEQVRAATFLGLAHYGVSENGVLAYLGGGQTQWTWFDRSGRQLGAAGNPGTFGTSVRLSADEKQLAVELYDLDAHKNDIWLIELARGISSRFTSAPRDNLVPVWSPDSKHIAFSSNREGVFDLYVKETGGGNNEELLLKSPLDKFASDWSPDGRFLLYVEVDPKTGADLWLLPFSGDRKPTPFLKTEFVEGDGVFSPDGRFVAYSSNESGKLELYVRPFKRTGTSSRSEPEHQKKWQISNGLSLYPRWRPDGRELFYRTGDPSVIAVPVKSAPIFELGLPRPLFAPFSGYGGVSSFAVTRDGQRFLFRVPFEYTSTPITVVVNWTELLKP